MSKKQTQQETEPQQPVAEPELPQPVANHDPNLFAAVYQRQTRTGPGALQGGGIIRRQRVTVPINGEECAPGVFCDEDGNPYEFELTLEALSVARELEATRGCDEPASLGHATVRASIVALNGTPIADDAQREFLWEALGPSRQLAVAAYQLIGSLAPASLGKGLRRCTVS